MFEINIEKALKEGTLREKIDNMKREIEQRQEEIKKCEKALEESKKCEKALEESKKPKISIPFFPKEGERYWYADVFGDTFETTFDGWKEDIASSKTGCCHHTEEEARLAYERSCAEIELLMMCDGLEREEQCFVPYFDDKKWCVDRCSWYKPCPYRFSSKDSCKSAIKKLGDRKLRLIFNIPLEN